VRAALVGLGLVGVVACGTQTETVTRTVVFHAPAACPVGASPFALVTAAGDFQPDPRLRATDQVFLDRQGEVFANMPAETRALAATVTADGAGNLVWRGAGGVAPSGDVDVLLWPSTGACALSQPDAPLPVREGAAIGMIDARRTLVAGGELSPPASFIADVTTGVVTRVAPDLTVARSAATVTPFGEGRALVAGGTRVGVGDPLDSAEVLKGTGFDDSARIFLSVPRASHGAVVLATGETLLVGGIGPKGAPLGTIEILDPNSPRPRLTRSDHPELPLPTLDVPRSQPTVLRLTNGEILIAGGVGADEQPVSLLEWLSGDGNVHKRSRNLIATPERAFTPLAGGGALAVMAPPGPLEDFKNVWVITADGDLESAASIPGPIPHVRLFPGAAGAPRLWTGDRWLRWEPWHGDFTLIADVVSPTGPSRSAIVSPDPGLAAWLGDDDGNAALFGLRFDTRSPYTTDSVRGPLLANDTAFLAPDRLVTLAPGAPISFDGDKGLVLSPLASAFVTDSTFASFTLDLAITPGAAPILVLRDEAGAELEIGGVACVPAVPASASAVHVERDGKDVRVRFGDGDTQTCTWDYHDAARVSIGVRGRGDSESSAKNLVIVRR
jgi:hypothetical protein